MSDAASAAVRCRAAAGLPFLIGIAVLQGLTVEIDTFHGSDARVYQLPTILQFRERPRPLRLPVGPDAAVPPAHRRLGQARRLRAVEAAPAQRGVLLRRGAGAAAPAAPRDAARRLAGLRAHARCSCCRPTSSAPRSRCSPTTWRSCSRCSRSSASTPTALAGSLARVRARLPGDRGRAAHAPGLRLARAGGRRSSSCSRERVAQARRRPAPRCWRWRSHRWRRSRSSGTGSCRPAPTRPRAGCARTARASRATRSRCARWASRSRWLGVLRRRCCSAALAPPAPRALGVRGLAADARRRDRRRSASPSRWCSISPLAYRPIAPARAGDAGYLWQSPTRFPELLGSSLLFWLLVPLGCVGGRAARAPRGLVAAAVYLGLLPAGRAAGAARLPEVLRSVRAACAGPAGASARPRDAAGTTPAWRSCAWPSWPTRSASRASDPPSRPRRSRTRASRSARSPAGSPAAP